MIAYPALIAALADRDLDEVAAAAAIPAEHLAALAAGGRAPSPAIRDRLARALGANPVELFRAVSRLERIDIDLEPALAAAPSRCVTDPATLRLIDRTAS